MEKTEKKKEGSNQSEKEKVCSSEVLGCMCCFYYSNGQRLEEL